MTESPIVLNVPIEAKPGREDELGGELRALVAPTRQEPGCLVYELHRDPKQPQKFMFYEKFKDQDALTAHLRSGHFQKFQDYRVAQDDPIAAQTVTTWTTVS